MLENQAVIGDTDMRQAIQQDALRLAGKALDDFEAADSTDITRFMKKGGAGSVAPQGETFAEQAWFTALKAAVEA